MTPHDQKRDNPRLQRHQRRILHRSASATIEQLERRTLLAALTIAQENQLPGNPQSEWGIGGSGDPSLQGFATDISVDQGQPIQFKITDTNLAPYRIDVYRMGYYGGMGARKVHTIPSSQTLRVIQPAPIRDSVTGLIDAGNWSVAASWNVPSDATSGIYFARLVREDIADSASYIIFIVRDDDGQSDMLFQTSDSTWQAYNIWGGKSLYVGSPRARMVSYNRPFTTRTDTFGGRDFVFGAEYPMVRWIEANGYDVSYFTNVDTARRGHELLEHKVFMSVGHDEYWSNEMRDAVTVARDTGVHLSFFSGNEMYWKVRWENAYSADGTPFRTMVCYKETNDNAKVDPSPLWTGTWRDPRFSPPSDGGRPENAVTGQFWTVNRGPGGETGTPFEVPAEFGNLRFWRNTSIADLEPGEVATVGDLVLGYEWDEDLDNGFRPAGLIRMSSTTQNVPQKMLDYGSTVGPGVATHTLTLYRAVSGALVFGAGTVQWSWGLDGTHDGIQTTPDIRMRQATVNLFADMGVQPATLQPGLVPASPSSDVAPPNAVITDPVNGADVIAGTAVTISGTASDTGGGVVGGVEVSMDGGATWRRAEGREEWSFTWIPSAVGPTTLVARAADDSCNLQMTYTGVPVTVHAQPTSTTGLVGAWSFNAGSGTAVADGSGTGNNGTLNGPAWSSGLFGGGLFFDGIDDWVTVPDHSSLRLTNGMTVEAWVKPTTISTGWTTVVMKERSRGFNYALYASDDNDKPPAGYINVSASDRAAAGVTLLPLNSWSHLATTYDGNTIRLYVNGTEVGSRLVGGSITTSTSPLRFGGNSVDGEHFSGWIDEVRVYNRPLNEGEIHVDMSTPISGVIETTPPVVAIASPAAGSLVSGNTTIGVSASDNVIVAGVQLFLDGEPLGAEDSSFPHSFVWDTTAYANGTYALTARARDFAGNVAFSIPVSLTVNNAPDTVPPSVVLRHPPDGLLVSGAVPLWATAFDNIAVTGVRFKLNGSDIGDEDLSAPFMMSFDTTGLTDGAATLTAVARDAAGNTTTSAPLTIVVDNTRPSVLVQSPAPGATNIATNAAVQVTFAENVIPATIALELRNSLNQLVAGALSYDNASHIATFTPSGNLSLDETYSVALSGARDAAGNTMTPLTWSFTTSPSVVNATIWNSTVVPAVPADNDTSAIELGVRFRADVDGYITGIRFYKGVGNGGTHVGHLWTNGGQLLQTVAFTNETGSGWQQANFTTPVAISAGVTYVASYYAPVGRYAANPAYFATAGFDSGLLHALRDGLDGSNGVYRYGEGGGFPSSTFNSTNYWVDIVFANTLADFTPPSVVNHVPPAGATGVAIGQNITATFSEDVVPGTISFELRDEGNTLIPATLTYDAPSRTATLNPNADLVYDSTYVATISGVEDPTGNTMSAFSWSFATAVGPDVIPPTVVNRSPAAGATNTAIIGNVTATFSEPIDPTTLSFALREPDNDVVPATVTYDAATRTATLDPNGPLAFLTSYTATVSASDLAGNPMSAPASWSFTTDAPIVAASLWNSSVTPAITAVNDPAPVELGVKFRAAMDGYITGIRFYKGTGNGGVHVAHLWTLGGTLLTTATFVGESGSGWQEVEFPTPVQVAANTTYVASYYAPQGRYSADVAYFAGSAFANGPLTALINAGIDGGNGVYRYGVGGGFPTSSYQATNYWVDVVYTNALPSDSTPPSIVSTAPANGASNVAYGSNITATFSEAVQPGTISFVVRNPQGDVVPGTMSYDPSTRIATFDPTSSLAPQTTFTATVSGAADGTGNVMSDFSWSFTVAPHVTNATIWAPTVTPAVAEANDRDALEIGLKFRTDVDGFVSGVRFYKGVGNVGTHVGRLWASDGTLLGSVTFLNETGSGWQQANFVTPIAVFAGQTYVISYYAPVGRYAVTGAYFGSSGVTNGPLTALATGVDGGNGVYRYGTGGGFPNQTHNASNYWVDVVFSTLPSDVDPPIVTQTSPADGAIDVPLNVNVTATFNEAVQAGSISFVLRDVLNNVIASNVTYDSVTQTVTLDPLADLAEGAVYTATLSGVRDTAGNLMPTRTWSFTTVAPIVGASIWSETVVPTVTSANDAGAVELGVKFRSTRSGYVTGIQFYKGEGNIGTHVGRLWSANGTLLASVTFVDETPGGWQQANFDTPVAIVAGQTYIVSYHAPFGHYAIDVDYFATSGTTNGPLTALANGLDGGNGVYRYGPGGVFPDQSFAASNYWVDVVFSTVPPGGTTPSNPAGTLTGARDTRPPTVVGITPNNGAADVAPMGRISVTFDEPVRPGSITLRVLNNLGNEVPAGVMYDPVTRTATLHPTPPDGRPGGCCGQCAHCPLATGTDFEVLLSGVQDEAGNMIDPLRWSFRTSDLIANASLWGRSDSPQVSFVRDNSPANIGMKFHVLQDGFITGMRFFKGAGNGGAHVGHLWTGDGIPLASAEFEAETESGWQRVNFDGAVFVTAGTTYVVSYFAPTGGYAETAGFFTSSDLSNGPIRAFGGSMMGGGNGVFLHGEEPAFPANVSAGSNFWVDVVYSNTLPTVVTQWPAPDETQVALGADIKARFSTTIDFSSLSFVLRDAAGATIPASVTYDGSRFTAILNPASDLIAGATYTAAIDTVDSFGNPLTTVTWSFRVAGSFDQPPGETNADVANGDAEKGLVITSVQDDLSLAGERDPVPLDASLVFGQRVDLWSALGQSDDSDETPELVGLG
jgi:methionine-rich copper-binding protein CopC